MNKRRRTTASNLCSGVAALLVWCSAFALGAQEVGIACTCILAALVVLGTHSLLRLPPGRSHMVDQSFSGEAIRKSMTGRTDMVPDPSKVRVSKSGHLVPRYSTVCRLCGALLDLSEEETVYCVNKRRRKKLKKYLLALASIAFRNMAYACSLVLYLGVRDKMYKEATLAGALAFISVAVSEAIDNKSA